MKKRYNMFIGLTQGNEKTCLGVPGNSGIAASEQVLHCFAMAVAAMWAVVQAAWKLKPPVMPSMSMHSPVK